MANKPSYAAVASSEPTANPKAGKSDAPQDAPPPYSGPSGSQPQPQPPAPQPIPVPHPHQHHLESGPPVQIHGQAPGWAPPPTPQVARSRAIRRFWVSFAYAWLIWVFVGFVIGGGVSDISNEPVGRHGHWDRNGNWRNDAAAVSYSWFGYGNEANVNEDGSGLGDQQLER